jgi:hypothetical protein
VLESDKDTPNPTQSPKYQTSNDSTSATDSDDGGDGGSQYHIEPSGGVHSSQVTSTNYVT